MTTEYTPRMRALERIARSIAEHQAVRREDGPFSTCKNPACNGVIFLNLNDRYNHQAAVLVNDLQADLDWYLQILREDAAEDGRELTDEEVAEARAEYRILAPSTAPDPAQREMEVDRFSSSGLADGGDSDCQLRTHHAHDSAH